MYKFLKWSLWGLVIATVILLLMVGLTENGPDIENEVFLGLMLLCTIGISCVAILFVWYKGELTSIAWYRKHGIPGEVTLQGIKVAHIQGQYSSVTRYTLVAKGVNPVTQQDQVFTRECSRKYREKFHPGDKFTVYIHSKRSKIADSAYKIDLKSKAIHNRS